MVKKSPTSRPRSVGSRAVTDWQRLSGVRDAERGGRAVLASSDTALQTFRSTFTRVTSFD